MGFGFWGGGGGERERRRGREEERAPSSSSRPLLHTTQHKAHPANFTRPDYIEVAVHEHMTITRKTLEVRLRARAFACSLTNVEPHSPALLPLSSSPASPTNQQRIKWALYLTIPVGVGYGLGSNQTTLEIIKRVVRASKRESGGVAIARRRRRNPGPKLIILALPPPLYNYHQQFPNAASDPQGDHGRRLQTLEDAYREHLLEQAVDAALADARAKNAAAAKGKGADSDDSSSKKQKKSGFWSRGSSNSSSTDTSK